MADENVCLIWTNPTTYETDVYIFPAEEWSTTISKLFGGKWFLNAEAIHTITCIWDEAGYKKDLEGQTVCDEGCMVVTWFPKEACLCRVEGHCACTESKSGCGTSCEFCARPAEPLALTYALPTSPNVQTVPPTDVTSPTASPPV